MPTEIIKITSDEFRATSLTNQITFSSKNQYIKTDVNGTLKAGGYTRAPFLAGFEYTQDRPTCGGFGTFNNGGYYTTGDMSFVVPFWNSLMRVHSPAYEQPTTPHSFVYINLNTNDGEPGGFYAITGPRPYYIDGVQAPGTCQVGMTSGYYNGAKVGQWPVNFDYSVPGVYSFGPVVPHTETWYRTTTGAPINYTSSSLFVWRKLYMNFTQSAINLELAVTP